MEPDKFERYIKNKLAERKIFPSDEAWERIADQLDSPSEKKRSTYFWMGIAASIVVVVGLSLFYLSKESVTDVGTDKIVTKEDTFIEGTLDTTPETLADEVVEQDAVVLEEAVEVAPKKQSVVRTKEVLAEEILVDSSALAAEVGQVAPLKDDMPPLVIPNAILEAKIREVVAQVDAIEVMGRVTDAEVDSLLQRAQQEIFRDRLFNPDKSVNAVALLTEVEEELDQSFRNQIFETLKKGFLKVRTAVADRNH